MVRVFTLVAASAVSAAVFASSTGAVVSAADTCAAMDFTKGDDVQQLNMLISGWKRSDLFTYQLQKFNSFDINDTPIDTFPLQIMGTDFLLTPQVTSFSVADISGAAPSGPVTATASNVLSVSIKSSKDVKVSAKLVLEVKHKKRAFSSPCFTDDDLPVRCNPLKLEVNLSATFKNVALATATQIDMKQFSLIALLPAWLGDDAAIYDSALSHLQGAQVQDVQVTSLSAVEGLKIDHKETKFADWYFIGQLKSELQKLPRQQVAQFIKQLLNKSTQDRAAPKFQNKC